jgi:hypothetical protein
MLCVEPERNFATKSFCTFFACMYNLSASFNATRCRPALTILASLFSFIGGVFVAFDDTLLAFAVAREI